MVWFNLIYGTHCIIQTLRTIMSPPPMVTCLAFYPEDNNIFGIGFDDSSLSIYNVRDDQVYISLSLFYKDMFHYMFQTTSKLLSVSLSYIYVRFYKSLRVILKELPLLPSQALPIFLYLLMQMLRLLFNVLSINHVNLFFLDFNDN